MTFLVMRAPALLITCCICGEKPVYYPGTLIDRFGCKKHLVRETESEKAGMDIEVFWNLRNTGLTDYVRRYK